MLDGGAFDRDRPEADEASGRAALHQPGIEAAGFQFADAVADLAQMAEFDAAKSLAFGRVDPG